MVTQVLHNKLKDGQTRESEMFGVFKWWADTGLDMPPSLEAVNDRG